MVKNTRFRKLSLALTASLLAMFCGISSGYAQQQPVTGTLETGDAPSTDTSIEAPSTPSDSAAEAPVAAPTATAPPPPSPPPAAAPSLTTAPAQPTVAQAAPAPLEAEEPVADSESQAAKRRNDEATDDETKTDMAGRTGFVVGLSGGGDETPLTVGTSLGLRSWLGDAVALQPRLQIDFSYDDQSDIFGYGVTPAIGMLFAIYRGKSTRVNFGFGFEFGFYGKKDIGDSGNSGDVYPDSTDDTIDDSSSSLPLYKAYENENIHSDGMSSVSPGYQSFYLGLPLELQIEHFFSNRFSGFVGAKFPLVSFVQLKADEGGADPVNAFSFSLDSTSLVMGVIFYTD